MSDAPAVVTSLPAKPSARPTHISRRSWRRILSIVLVLGIFLCLLLPTAFLALFGFNNPPSWITDPYEYKVSSSLALAASVITFAIIAMSWLLGVVGAIAGGNALGGASRSLRRRLHIVRRRLAVITAMAVWLRISLLSILVIASVFAYTRYLGPQVQSGLPLTIREVVGRNTFSLILVAITVIFWLVAPILRTRYSTALGALAASYTKGRTERVSYALGARFGIELLGTLGGLWGTTIILLVVLSIVDPSSYRSSVPMPSGPIKVMGIPLIVLLLTMFAVVYGIGQIMLAEMYHSMAVSRMIRKQKAAHKAAE